MNSMREARKENELKAHVGIEAMAVAVPHRYVDLEDLAKARNVDPAKYTQGLGAKQMAVNEPGEDTVALAATAADRVLRAAKVDPARIGMLVVGTETGVDHSKPVASFVQGLLGLPSTLRTYDTQHACYGGTAALMASAEWIASGAARGRSALVICSDIARYGLNTAGEPTQGGGAVAMLVSDNPELLALDIGLSGVYSAHVHDFWRPLGQREAQVDGQYSIQCYLDAVSGAYRGWRDLALSKEVIREGTAALPSEQLARILYHVPFCKMAKKAHLQVRRVDLEDRAKRPLDAVEEEREAPHAQASFNAQVASSLELCARVGNVYTGSLYFSLAGLLLKEAQTLAGKRVGLFSYGSGSSSEFFSGVVGPRADERIAASGIQAAFDARERVSIAEYEDLMKCSPLEPRAAPVAPGHFRFTGVDKHRRQYAAGPRG
jgi:hydroxymethylglutaryl-CoA synthase